MIPREALQKVQAGAAAMTRARGIESVGSDPKEAIRQAIACLETALRELRAAYPDLPDRGLIMRGRYVGTVGDPDGVAIVPTDDTPLPPHGLDAGTAVVVRRAEVEA